MRFLVDESTGPGVARWLRGKGHDVYSIYEEARGADDDSVIGIAFEENRILITNDKDFGAKVFRENRPHRGVVLLRLDDERTNNKVTVLERLLGTRAEQLPGRFVVVTERHVRFTPVSSRDDQDE
jgi:predicted nuclease of predicted toxin-antitoxin system